MEKGRVLTGARARFLLNGKKVGYATRVAYSEELEYQPVDVLDNIQSEEHVPVGYRVQLSCGTVRIVGETVKSQGYFPSIGATPEEHLNNVLVSGVLTATILDSKTGRPILQVEQVKLSSRSASVDARGMVGEDLTFVAIRARDESTG